MGRTAKRTAGKFDEPTAKKVKTVDPIQEKVDNLLQVFQDEDQVGILSLSDAAKEMMQSVIPLALGVSSDKRHTFQVQMVDSVGVVLKEVVQTWEARIAEAECNIKSEESIKAETTAKIEESESSLEARRLEETQAQETMDAAEKAAKEALSKCTSAHDEVDVFDVDLDRKHSDRAHMQTLIETNFAALKDGEFKGAVQQRKLMVPINLMLQQLKADEVLVAALALALNKKPEARGPFANLAVEELEKMLRKNLEDMDEHIANASSIKAEKSAAAAEAKTELEEAEAHKSSSCDAFTAALDARKLNETTLKQLQKELKDQEKKAVQLHAQLTDNESELTAAKENLIMFEFLNEHVVKEDEDEDEDEMQTEEQSVSAQMADEVETVVKGSSPTTKTLDDLAEEVDAVEEGDTTTTKTVDGLVCTTVLESVPSPLKTRPAVIA